MLSCSNLRCNGSLYRFKAADIRVVEIDGQPWFALAYIRSVLLMACGGKRDFLLASEQRAIGELNGVTLKGHGLAHCRKWALQAGHAL